SADGTDQTIFHRPDGATEIRHPDGSFTVNGEQAEPLAEILALTYVIRGIDPNDTSKILYEQIGRSDGRMEVNFYNSNTGATLSHPSVVFSEITSTPIFHFLREADLTTIEQYYHPDEGPVSFSETEIVAFDHESARGIDNQEMGAIVSDGLLTFFVEDSTN